MKVSSSVVNICSADQKVPGNPWDALLICTLYKTLLFNAHSSIHAMAFCLICFFLPILVSKSGQIAKLRSTQQACVQLYVSVYLCL
jgi:hypothetical protein